MWKVLCQSDAQQTKSPGWSPGWPVTRSGTLARPPRSSDARLHLESEGEDSVCVSLRVM